MQKQTKWLSQNIHFYEIPRMNIFNTGVRDKHEMPLL